MRIFSALTYKVDAISIFYFIEIKDVILHFIEKLNVQDSKVIL